MNLKHSLCIMQLLGGSTGLIASQAEQGEPWDPVIAEIGQRGEVGRAEKTHVMSLKAAKRPQVIVAEWLIGFYQSNLSTRSISRCPFQISCSVFTKEAIRKKGILLGTSMFIDRFYFREHSYSARHYELRTGASGKLKLEFTI